MPGARGPSVNRSPGQHQPRIAPRGPLSDRARSIATTCAAAGLPPAELRSLTRLDTIRALLAVGETFVVIGVCVAAALLWWNPVVVVVAILVIATRQQALFVLAHDAAHYRLLENRAWNDLVGCLCGTLVGISMRTYRVVHRLHHNHLYDVRDPDLPLHGGYPRGRMYLLRKLARDCLGLTAWKTYAYFFGAPAINDAVGEGARPLDDTSGRLRRAARRDRWTVVAFHVAAPLVALGSGWGAEYLILWIVPLVSPLQMLLRFRAICEHGAVDDLGSPLTRRADQCGPGLAAVAPVSPPCELPHRAPRLSRHPALPASGLPRGFSTPRLARERRGTPDRPDRAAHLRVAGAHPGCLRIEASARHVRPEAGIGELGSVPQSRAPG